MQSRKQFRNDKSLAVIERPCSSALLVLFFLLLQLCPKSKSEKETESGGMWIFIPSHPRSHPPRFYPVQETKAQL